MHIASLFVGMHCRIQITDGPVPLQATAATMHSSVGFSAQWCPNSIPIATTDLGSCYKSITAQQPAELS